MIPSAYHQLTISLLITVKANITFIVLVKNLIPDTQNCICLSCYTLSHVELITPCKKFRGKAIVPTASRMTKKKNVVA